MLTLEVVAKDFLLFLTLSVSFCQLVSVFWQFSLEMWMCIFKLDATLMVLKKQREMILLISMPFVVTSGICANTLSLHNVCETSNTFYQPQQ